MKHIEIFTSPKDLVKLVNNYEPYIYRVLLKKEDDIEINSYYSRWNKPKHSFIDVDGFNWSAGNIPFAYDKTLEIVFRIKGKQGKEEFVFKLKK